MPTINPKTGKPYPNTPAGRAASDAEYKARQRAAARKAARAKSTMLGPGKNKKLAAKKKRMATSSFKKKGPR